MGDDTPVECNDTRLRDFLFGLPLVVLGAIALIGFAITISRQWGSPAFPGKLQILSESMAALFIAMQMGLVFVRHLPIQKAAGLLPRATALLAANLSYAIALLPHAAASQSLDVISTVLVLAGTAGSCITLFWLGRGFSILPQARQLATGGPYRIVRHPLYLCEQISVIGVSLHFIQPWALLITMAGLALQFPRMHFEEAVLADAFPQYRSYAAVTPQFIPFLNRHWMTLLWSRS